MAYMQEKRKVDELGRVVLPKRMLEELEVGDGREVILRMEEGSQVITIQQPE